MLQAYVDHVAERAALGIPPLPLSAKQTSEVIELMKSATAKDGEFLLNLLTHRVPAGVDDAAKVKASYLAAVAHGSTKYFMHPVNSRTGAIRLEDPRAEAMWLQLGNKSMLMSQKQGLRLADECQANEQATVAEDMKKNPPKSLFDGADAPKK